MRILIIIISILLHACSDNNQVTTTNNTTQGSMPIANTGTPKSLTADTVTPEIKTITASIPEEVEIYARELSVINNNPNTSAGVEGLLRLGKKASEILVRTPAEGGIDILERLSEEKYQEVIAKMKGYSINRQEVVFVEPDPEFFLDIAKRSNDQASIEFFQSYNITRPSGGWPAYVEQQTDYSGCIRFGTMSLLGTYTLWNNFRKNYPSRYTDEISDILRDVEFDLGDGTCACNSAKSAIAEFEAFIQSHPKVKLSSRLRERINHFNQGKSDLREHCLSG